MTEQAEIKDRESAESTVSVELNEALAKCVTAKRNIGIMIILTLVTMFLLLINSGYGFPFSAFIPQLCVAFAGSSETYALKFLCYGLSSGLLLLFAICWLFCLVRPFWYMFALFLFLGDSLVLYWFSANIEDPSWIDIGFHIWILYYMFMGVVASFKARKLLLLIESTSQQ